MSLAKSSSRTSEDEIQVLLHFYRLFHPTEIDFILDLNDKFSRLEITRISLITSHLRAAFNTDHSEVDVRTLIAYFTSSYTRLKIKHSFNLKSLIMSNGKTIPIEPYTNVCPQCHRTLSAADAKSKDVLLYSSQGSVLPACVYSLHCNHTSTTSDKSIPGVTIYSNFYTQENYNHYTSESLQFGEFIYISGAYASHRELVERYVCNLMGSPHSWLKTADSLNLQAYNASIQQLTIVNRKRLAQIVFIFKMIEIDLCLGSKHVKVPRLLKHFDQWAWNQYVRLFSRFIYVWSNHRTLIGPCSNNCTKSFTVDGHQKSRRRVCRSKEVHVVSPDFDEPLVVGCCRTPVPRSYYCDIHQDQKSDDAAAKNQESSDLSSVDQHRLRHQRLRTKSKSRFFGATNCNTRKAHSEGYIRRCSRSFGLLAVVTNCRIITSFSEIFRTETLREIIQLLINTIRIAGESVPKVACYDDGCHLVQYIHNHVGDRIIDSPYAHQLKNIKFSIDKAHWRNHVGVWCKKNMSPYTNKDLDNCNTQVAEHLFSWLKRYAPIISSLGWLRAPLYLLLLFHYKNLETTHTRPSHHFDITHLVPDVPHVSLAHAANNQFLAALNQQHDNTSMDICSSSEIASNKTSSTHLEITTSNNTLNKWMIEANKLYSKQSATTTSSMTLNRIATTDCLSSLDPRQTSFTTSKWSTMAAEIRKETGLNEKNGNRLNKRQKKTF